MGRSPCCDKNKVKRGTWSPQEDEILINYLQNHGTPTNWIALPHKAGLKRCGKSCRLRWLNYLRPDIKHGGFTQDEEYIICNLYNKIGSRWSVIASHLPGRTDNDVKNYWNTKLKKKFMATKSDIETSATAAGDRSAATVAAAAQNESLNFGSPRLILERSSDCSSGGSGNDNDNDVNYHFCPPYLQQDPSPFWSFCLGSCGSNEVELLDEFVSGIWTGDEAVGADMDADIFRVDSTLHGQSQAHLQ